MSDKLITSIYEITKNYYDPVSNIPLNENNSNFGKWDNKTSKIYEDVIQSIIDKK